MFKGGKMRSFILMICICFGLFAQESYKFGVFPHMPLEKLHEIYSPIADDLEEHVCKKFILMTKPYYKLYKDELNEGVYDIAFIQPFDYVQAHKEQGYIPIARRKQDLKAILVVSKASKYMSISDIKDKVIASAPAEAAVTQMMFIDLKKQGYRVLDDFTISYNKNHFRCLQKLVDSEAVACITAQRAVEYFNNEKKSNAFRTIYTTEALPHALFVVHPRVPKEIREEIKNRILSWNKDERSKEMLTKGNLLDFVETIDSDYDRVREFLKDKE